MALSKKSKSERRKEREILQQYHQKVTEDELQPLYKNFQKWSIGELPYDELTERIHEFHKKNQKIFSMFHDPFDEEYLVFKAKNDMGILSDEDRERYADWINFFE
jgi:hypothetical protein